MCKGAGVYYIQCMEVDVMPQTLFFSENNTMQGFLDGSVLAIVMSSEVLMMMNLTLHPHDIPMKITATLMQAI